MPVNKSTSAIMAAAPVWLSEQAMAATSESIQPEKSGLLDYLGGDPKVIVGVFLGAVIVREFFGGINQNNDLQFQMLRDGLAELKAQSKEGLAELKGQIITRTDVVVTLSILIGFAGIGLFFVPKA